MNEKGLLGPHACKTLYLWPDLARTINIALHKKFFKASFCAAQKVHLCFCLRIPWVAIKNNLAAQRYHWFVQVKWIQYDNIFVLYLLHIRVLRATGSSVGNLYKKKRNPFPQTERSLQQLNEALFRSVLIQAKQHFALPFVVWHPSLLPFCVSTL